MTKDKKIKFYDHSVVECLEIKQQKNNTVFVKWKSKNGVIHTMYLPKEYLK